MLKARKVLILPLVGFLIILNVQNILAQQPASQLSLDEAFYDVEWSPNSEMLAVTGSEGTTIYTSSLQEIAHFRGHPSGVGQVSWHPSGTLLATTGANDNSVRIWQFDSKTNSFSLLTTLLPGHTYVISAVWSPDGMKLAIIGLDQPLGESGMIGTPEVWIGSGAKWTLQKVLSKKYGFPSRDLVWSPDSTQIAGVGNACRTPEMPCPDEPLFFIANAVSGETLYGVYDPIPPYSLAWSHFTETNKLAVGTSELMIYDPINGQKLASWSSSDPNATRLRVDWSPDGKYVLAGSGKNGEISVIDVNTTSPALEFNTWQEITDLDWSPDGKSLAISSRAGIVQIWDMTSLLPDTTPPASTDEP